MSGIDPSEALAPGSPSHDVLARCQVEQWREQGFALVGGVLPADLLREAREDAAAAFPSAGSAEAEAMHDFGGRGRMVFPTSSAAVNAITLHPRLLRAAAQLLGVPVAELRLTQSEVWPKYGRREKAGGEGDNLDQRMHVDYPNHTLAHPPPWDAPEAVELIVHLDDAEACGGATALVPRTGPDDPAYAWPIACTPGVGALDWVNDRASAEAYLERKAPEIARWRARHLYPREVEARHRRGSVLFYRHDTWHRGTPVAPGAVRFAQNLTFRKAGSEWISVLHPGWAWAMYQPSRVMERLVATASVEQRCVLGFPGPGHPYWTRATVAAVAARYGPLGMDVSPYQEALA